MSFAANAQLTVDCKTTTAISGTDTNYVHTDLIYQMLVLKKLYMLLGHLYFMLYKFTKIL